jgi:DNA-binding beta-propeller fold protein YncE
VVRRVWGCVAVALVCCIAPILTATATAKEIFYAADGAGGNLSHLYVLDPSSGAVIQDVGPIGFAVTGLAVDPVDGTLYGSTSRQTSAGAPNPGSLIAIDRRTAVGRLVGDLRPDSETAADIAFTPDGALFGWLQPDSSDLVTIDKATGAASIVGDSGLNTEGSGLASSPAGVLFLAENADNGPLRTVDRNSGATATVATMNGTKGFRIPALAFDAAGTLFGGRQGGSPFFEADLITIDPTTGAVASRGPLPPRLDALTFTASTRTITFDAAKVKATKKKKKRAATAAVTVRRGKKARFSGNLSAPGSAVVCQSNQTVELQRKKPKRAAAFTTFMLLQTDAAGHFSVKRKVKKTFKYRAIVGADSLCDAAASTGEKVRVKKKKKKK